MIRARAAVAMGALLSTMAFAQTAPDGPTFEVASVKRNTTGERPSDAEKPGRITMYNMPLVVLLAKAYGVSNDKVLGPSWLNVEGYDIVAKFPPETTNGDTFWVMMRNLLIERFQLKVHRDQTPATVYALAVVKDGAKLKPSAAGTEYKQKCALQGPKVSCLNQNSTMEQLAQNLPRWNSRDFFELPIVDQTGLAGGYDFTLTWTLTDRPPDSEARATDTSDPSPVFLFDALRDQLGLKLERRKVSVERIVIDHIERIPTEN